MRRSVSDEQSPLRVSPSALARFAQRLGDLETTASLHVTDGSGKIVAQSDHQPDGSRFPTNSWQQGDVIEDRFDIPLPALEAAGGPRARRHRSAQEVTR